MEKIYVLSLLKEDRTMRNDYIVPESIVGYYATKEAAESALRAELSKVNNHSFEAWARELGYEPWVTVDENNNGAVVRFYADREYGWEGENEILEDTVYTYTITDYKVIGS